MCYDSCVDSASSYEVAGSMSGAQYAVCSHCDRRRSIRKQCEEAGKYGGHEIIGATISNAVPASVASAFVSLRLGDDQNDSDDSDYGGYSDHDDGYHVPYGKRVIRESSPEWYDEPDDI